MIPRGKPFPAGAPLRLLCPNCLLSGTDEPLTAAPVLDLARDEREHAPEPPFVRYWCRTCRYIEIHLRILTGPA